MPSINVTSSALSQESPITPNVLIDILNNDEAVKLYTERNDLIQYLLSKFQAKSSKFKFMVQATSLKSESEINSNLLIASSFGAVWDSDKDGYISVNVNIVDDDSHNESIQNILITVYWLFVD